MGVLPMGRQEGGLVAQSCAPHMRASRVQLQPLGYDHRRKAEESSSKMGDAPASLERWTASPSTLNTNLGPAHGPAHLFF